MIDITDGVEITEPYYFLYLLTPECTFSRYFLHSIINFKLTSPMFKEIRRILHSDAFIKH